MPRIYMIGGPNGAGKSTAALSLLPKGLNCEEFVNADAIASGLSPFRPESVALEAGRLMIERIRRLAKGKRSFAFETTMAARSFAPFLRDCRADGYEIQLIFLWLNSPELALARIADRVRQGGHDITEEIVRRRYRRGLKNFFDLYISLADGWVLYDNSGKAPKRIAYLDNEGRTIVENDRIWSSIESMRE